MTTTLNLPYTSILKGPLKGPRYFTGNLSSLSIILPFGLLSRLGIHGFPLLRAGALPLRRRGPYFGAQVTCYLLRFDMHCPEPWDPKSRSTLGLHNHRSIRVVRNWEVSFLGFFQGSGSLELDSLSLEVLHG